AVAGQVGVALQRVDLVGELAKRERMRRELEIAREVQQALAPKHIPQISGVEIAAASIPALEVGGDFYDTLRLPDGRLGLLVGDVAGKGVPAALLAAALLSGFRALAPSEASPGRLLARLNEVLCAHRRGPGVWASAIYAVFDPQTRQLVYATAGHPPPLAKPNPLACEGMALGVLAEVEYRDCVADLDRQAVFVLYTDGLEDVQGPDGQTLDFASIEQRFSERGGMGATAVVEGLIDQALAHAAGANLYDDVTLVALCVQR
ncbi:MAG: PP2C family protein-serine/threonine phosphatase, partial [Cyanobacteria bacterium REEB65]|nr:PP2C family protein-serine/threonine phosphatase [Cyanobacteria bacterium REEB65]